MTRVFDEDLTAGFGTRAIHAGQRPEPLARLISVCEPIVEECRGLIAAPVEEKKIAGTRRWGNRAGKR